MKQSIHESDDRLELYALGRLPDSDKEIIEEHLLACEHCCERLEEAGSFAGSIRQALLLDPVPAREAKGSSWFAWLSQPRFAMAGGFAAVLLAAGLYWSAGANRVAPMATLQLTAMRGDMQTVSQAKELDLTLTDVPSADRPFQVELVDGSGSKVWNGPATEATAEAHARIERRLSPGDYFVRLYGVSGKLLHEYGFRVHD